MPRMKIDLHFHGVRKKRDDWQGRLRSMMEKAAQERLGAVALLDHDYHPTDEDVALAHEAAPAVKIFKAVEFSVRDNCRKITDHLIVVSDEPYGWDISGGITTAELHKLREYVGRSGALTILAHPFRRHPNISFDFYDLLPDAVEIASPSTPAERRHDILRMAVRWGMAMVENSDSHRAAHVGRFFMDVPDWVVGNKDTLATAIRAGICGCHALIGFPESYLFGRNRPGQ